MFVIRLLAFQRAKLQIKALLAKLFSLFLCSLAFLLAMIMAIRNYFTIFAKSFFSK